MRLFIRSAMIGLTLSSTLAGAMPLYRDHFVHEKSGYVVDTRTVGGTMRLTGRHPTTGATFKLKVLASGRVTGSWNGAPVNFVMNQAKSPAEFDMASIQGSAGAK